MPNAARRLLPNAARRLVPNAITILRLVCVPAVVWLILQAQLSWAFWLFVGAGLSDALDGALARLMRAQSALGSYLDALADKVLLVGVYVSLGLVGLIPGWLVSLVVCRDLLLTGFAVFMYLRRSERQVQPLFISKVNTLAQISLAGLVLGHQGMGWFPGGMVAPFGWLVATTTTASAVAYWVSWSRRMAEREGD